MTHHMSTKGYVLIIFFLYAGMTVLFNLTAALLAWLNVEISFEILIAIKALILFAAIFIAAGRFLSIEERTPHPSERDSISLWAFLTLILGMALAFPIGLGAAQSKPEVSQSEALASQSIILAILSLCGLVFLHLNFGVIARMRKSDM